jgi:polynucleotide 5'-hydroxyl-kinase GRC3/NOL9
MCGTDFYPLFMAWGTEEEYIVDMDIPTSWERSAAEIVEHKWRKVLIIGAVDRGKSTYCEFLSHRLLAAGFRVAVVDADIGQKDIGPPATITLGYPDPSQPLAEVEPVGLYFVGAVSPAGHLLPMVVGTRQLVDAAQAAFVVIDTTGFVDGVGRVLKGYKIEAIRPDVIVAIAQDAELQPILKAYRHYRVLRIPPSSRVVVRTSEQRREAREEAFCNYFQPATEVVLPYRRLIFQRILALTELQKHLLCGLVDRRNRGVGLAIISGRDATQGALSLLTSVRAERIRIVQAGDLYLSQDGHELGRR